MDRMIPLLIIVGFIVCPVVSVAAEPDAGGGKRLAGMKWDPSWISHMACLVGCADYLKLDVPPAWIHGASAHAFALNIHPQLCPSGPTAWPTKKCNILVGDVGLHIKAHMTHSRDPNVAQRRREIFQQVRKAIDANRPCIGWEMGVPEWYPICGYDGAGNYLYLGFDGKVGKKEHEKLGDSGIGVTNVLIVEPGSRADDRTTVRESLRMALKIATGKCAWKNYAGGLAGYDAWIKGLDANGTLGLGAAYNAQCWAECRRNAVAFLALAAKRLPDKAMAPHFKQAINSYKAVSRQLDVVAETFPFNHRDQKMMDANLADPKRRAKAAEALRKARKAERAGIQALAKLAVALGAKDVNPDKLALPE